MNFDLSKFTFTNIFILGVGTTFLFVLLFFPDGLTAFMNPIIYFVAVLVGFIMVPLSYPKRFKEENENVYNLVRDLIKKGDNKNNILDSILKSFYELFLRESPLSKSVISRIHYRGEQLRIMYGIGMLLKCSSYLVILALIIKIILTEPCIPLCLNTNLPDNSLGLILIFIGSIGLYLSGKYFYIRGNEILSHNRNFEKIHLIRYRHIVEEISKDLFTKNNLLDKHISQPSFSFIEKILKSIFNFFAG